MEIQEPPNQKDDDDEFGEFGEFDSSAQVEFQSAPSQPVPPVEQQPQQVPFPTFPKPETYEPEESRLDSIVPNDNLDPAFNLIQIIKETFTLSPLVSFSSTITAKIISEDWENAVLGLEKTFSGEVFRWRKSFIRHDFISALTKSSSDDLKSDEIIQQEDKLSNYNPGTTSNKAGDLIERVDDIPTPIKESLMKQSFDTDDLGEQELITAKKLVDIPVTEISQKSPEQLQQLISSLQEYNARIQAQTDFYLDAKEQLVIDAEMHNRMIAQLVTYAQQQQEESKGILHTKSIVAKKGMKKK